MYEFFATDKSENIFGCMIFAKISIPSIVLILGLLKNEFASTANTFPFFTACSLFHY